MDWLGDDLLLLAVRANGTLAVREKLRFGMAGAELVRLAACGRVDIQRGRIVILDITPTGDPLLDAALASMTGRKRPPTAKAWVARIRSGLVERHLDRLAAAGTVAARRSKALGFIPVTRWAVTDPPRQAQARARLDAIAGGAGEVDLAQAALAGLADAIGLAGLFYRGIEHKRIKVAVKSHQTAAGAASAVRNATEEAVAQSVDAATQAAVQAATDAAHHAAHSAGGGHHGGAAGGHHG
jgi:Golgi phosphoprotein 3 GPP34